MEAALDVGGEMDRLSGRHRPGLGLVLGVAQATVQFAKLGLHLRGLAAERVLADLRVRPHVHQMVQAPVGAIASTPK